MPCILVDPLAGESGLPHLGVERHPPRHDERHTDQHDHQPVIHPFSPFAVGQGNEKQAEHHDGNQHQVPRIRNNAVDDRTGEINVKMKVKGFKKQERNGSKHSQEESIDSYDPGSHARNLILCPGVP